jgi:hypothetical protein
MPRNWRLARKNRNPALANIIETVSNHYHNAREEIYNERRAKLNVHYVNTYFLSLCVPIREAFHTIYALQEPKFFVM